MDNIFDNKEPTKIEQGNLFDSVLLPEGGRVQDNTDITTMILYFSTEEISEVKKNIKRGIKKMYGQEAIQRGNVSDFIKELVKRYNEE